MASLSQAPRLGYLPSPHVAFQEHAAHMARWPTMLNSKGSWNTCILQGLTTFLPCAFTAHRQPAMERSVAHAFEGMQHPQGDHLTGPEVRLGVFGAVVHLPIDVVEQGDDKVPCGHAALLVGEGRHADQHGRVIGRRQAQKCVFLVCKDLYVFIAYYRLTPSVNSPGRACSTMAGGGNGTQRAPTPTCHPSP